MVKTLAGLSAELVETQRLAATHYAEDKASFAELFQSFRDMKAELKAEIKGGIEGLGARLSAITADVDVLKTERIEAQTRAKVLKEVAEARREDILAKDLEDEKKSRWRVPIIAALCAALLSTGGGWFLDHNAQARGSVPVRHAP